MISIRTFRIPGWVVPVMVLLALALLPFALLFAAGVGVLALGASLVGALLGGSRPQGTPKGGRMGAPDQGQRVIDADYEVKDEKDGPKAG